jgi:hypothetical protein
MLCFDAMLQAQIEIVDEGGRTEDSVTIVGSGEVSLRMHNGSYLHVDIAGLVKDSTSELAVISHSGSEITVQVKAGNALRQGGRYLAPGAVDVAEVWFVAEIERFRRVLKVRTVWVKGSALLAGGAVIRSTPSSLQSRLDEMALRGTQRVRDQLGRLQSQGKIDAAGDLLVPWPEDMKADSKTDV